ncbi:MAG: transposase [Gammaproteobacteria bacterium CG_4_10_14_0_8_um_filter_38_16]|nr:MAG: transposase [Gammaproteobacteria bacterium CG_4_10_14_0_8_um_filter_38_16]PJA03321.1 MAG: transposase [Gammaproteobacteria bacterium CG_4_10_14_0_2_um_filter_38_22]PJB09630.1 MAG: transposase [Gammaproteobacteria bacterium CG_4_9_14_3_um_filter_38_9]
MVKLMSKVHWMNTGKVTNFLPGEKFIFNGKLCSIQSALSLDTVLLKEVDSGKNCTAKINELILPDTDSVESEMPFFHIDLAIISERDLEKAKQREVVIKPLSVISCTRLEAEIAGKKLGLSARQIYKLIRRYRSSNNNLRSLIIVKKSGGKGKSRISDNVEVIIQSVIQEKYLSKQQIKMSVIAEEVCRRCFYANIKAPCSNTIAKRIQQLSTKEILTKRRGVDDARKYQPVVGSFPTPEHPLMILQIDHTPVDIIIVDEVYRKPIGRPYLTVAIDVYSRCITGFCLTLEPPSAVSVALCLTHSIFDKEGWLLDRKIDTNWPIWGKPNLVYVDNAKEFHSEALQRGCDAHGIKIDYRPVGQPHYGGIIERLIGTLMQLVHQVPGTTFSNITERGDYPSEQKAILTMSELEKWLTIAVTEYYHQKIHTGINMPPIEKFKIGILGDETNKGRGYFPRIQNKKAFLIDFLPVVRRTLQRHGFMLDHISYYSNSLSPMIANREKYGPFLIRRDPRDISRIYVLDHDSQSYLEIPYRTLSRPSITLWEHKQALNYLREKGLENKDENIIFQAIDKMRAITNDAIKSSKSARRRNERLQHAQIETSQKEEETSQNKIDEKHKIEIKHEKPAVPFMDIEIW